MTTDTYRFGAFRLASARRELWQGDALVQLSPRAFDCLVYLIEHRERVVEKDELVAAIWRRANVSDTQLGQTVLRARRAVGDDGAAQQVIRTVSRFGYRFVAEVHAESGSADPEPSTDAGPRDEAPAESAPAAPERVAGSIADARRRWPRAPVLAITALGLFGAAIALLYALHVTTGASARSAGAHRIAVVMPLRVAAASSNAWLRLGAMDLIAERLRSGGLSVPPSESVVALLQSASAAPDSDAELQAVRGSTAATFVVRGVAAQGPEGWDLRLQAIGADGATVSVQARQPDALRAAAEVADRLLARLGMSQPPPVATGSALQDRLQRAQAAMLANDLEAARAILASAPELERSELELRYRSAQVDFRAGRYAEAEAALSAVLDDPRASDPLVRARALNGRGAVRIRRDDVAGADADFAAALALLRDSDRPDETGRALMGSAITHMERQDFALALADFGAARVQLEKAGDALGIARVDANLGGLELERDRPEDAIGYLDSAAERFEHYGALNELFETLSSLFSARMSLLQPAAALAVSDRSWSLRDRATDPNQGASLLLDRIDVFLALGRCDDAGRLLEAMPDEVPQVNPFVARRAHVLRARLALERGRTDTALAEARRAYAMQAPADDRGEGRAEIALIHQRALVAAIAAGKDARSDARLETDEDASEYPVQGLIAAEWADFQANPAAAEHAFKRALDLAERRGEPADIAAVSESYGAWLLGKARLQEAAAVIGRVSPWSDRDYACALLQVRLFRALRQVGPWHAALDRARALAGERTIPADLLRPPA